MLSLPGLNTSVLQSVAQGKEGAYKISVKISFLLSLLGIPALLILGGYFYVSGDHALGLAFMGASLIFPFLYAPNTWDSYLQAKEKFDVAMKYSAIQSVLSTLTLIAIVFFYPENFILITLLYFALIAIFNILWYLLSRKYIANQNQDPETVSYGKFLTKVGIIGILSNNIDKKSKNQGVRHDR